MKKTNLLSLVAAVAIISGSSAVASDTSKTEVTGYAKAYYDSVDSDANSLLSQGSAKANIGLHVDVNHTFNKKVKANLGVSVLDTANLEDEVVSGVVAGASAHQTTLDIANIEITPQDNTNIKVGRMLYKSPLLNSDNWSVHKNTFEGIAVTHEMGKLMFQAAAFDKEHQRNAGTDFNEYASTMYTMGVTKKLKGAKANLHLYKSDEVTAVYASCGKAISTSLKMGAQVIHMNPDAAGSSTLGLGLKASKAVDAGVVTLAYSHIGNGVLPIGKLSDLGTKTPLYTTGFTSDTDVVGMSNSDTLKLSFKTKVAGANVVAFGLVTDNDSVGAGTSTEFGAKAIFKPSENTNLMVLGSVADHETGGFQGKDGLLRVVATYSF
jgi:hypothetical protein